MEATEVHTLVEGKVKEYIKDNNAELLRNIGTMMQQISAPTISNLTETPILKRKTNQEQFKVNQKVMNKIEEAEGNLTSQNLQAANQSLIEAKDIIKRRQKLIQLADNSDLGWRLVAEYEANPIASDSEDEKRIYKAEARATRKIKADKVKKRTLRPAPYSRTRRNDNATSTQPSPSPNYTSQNQRPGICFFCNKQGHWKRECPQKDRNNKISRNYDIIQTESSNTEQKDENKKEQGKIEHRKNNSPVGRLKESIEKWREITDSLYIRETIENGYKLPFKEMPSESILRNNKSARDNPEFVTKEIQALLRKGVISEVTDTPKVVNPLTVAYNKANKARLVLDCRHINPFLHLFKVKFEDIKIADQMFDKYSYVFTFDLKSAYHHIDIFPAHRTYLGFSWKDGSSEKFYCYNSLPFGIATAGHIFTKVLRCLVKHCRAKGHRVIMFLDDGIGGQTQFIKAKESSEFVRNSIIELGFLIAEEKCDWVPKRTAIWLGHILDFDRNRLFITEERVSRLLTAISSLLFQIKTESSNLIPVRYLASVTGQIISLQSVIGKRVCLRTRYLHKCIDSRIGWNCVVPVSSTAIEELTFWSNNVQKMNSQGKCLRQVFWTDLSVFTDASAVGYGGYIVTNQGTHEESQVVTDSKSTITVEPLSDMSCGVYEDQEKNQREIQTSAGCQSLQLKKTSWGSSKIPEKSQREVQSLTGCQSMQLPVVSCGTTEVQEKSKREVQNMTKRQSVKTQEMSFRASEAPEKHQKVEQNLTGCQKIQLHEVSYGTSEVQERSLEFRRYDGAKGIGLKESIKRKIDEAGIPVDDEETVIKRMATHILFSKAEGTVSKYYYQVKIFKDFCAEKGFPISPANPIHVAIFLSQMIDSGKSANVITSSYYAIKWLHNVNGHPDPTENSFVKNILESAKRLNSKPTVKKEVISTAHLIELCDKFIESTDVIVNRDLAMILLSYAGFLRFSEVSDLRCCDISFKPNHLALNIRKSKTDIYRSGKEVLIAKGFSSACPYAMLRKYIDCAGLDEGSDHYVFQPACRSGTNCFLLNKNKKLSYTRARECIIQKLKLVAPNLRLGTHSLRASGATVAANAEGVSDRCLKRHGRWRSETAKDGYIEDSTEKKLFITKQLKL